MEMKSIRKMEIPEVQSGKPAPPVRQIVITVEDENFGGWVGFGTGSSPIAGIVHELEDYVDRVVSIEFVEEEV